MLLSAAPPRENLSRLLERLSALAENEQAVGGVLTVRDIMTAVGRRAYGPLLLLVGLFSISPATIAPGMTWLSATLALFFALQLALGLRHPWLPRGLCELRASKASVRAAIASLHPWARRIDVLLAPRLVFLTEAPFVNAVGLLCAAAAIVTYPLGLIPIAPVAPGLAIVALGLGLFAKDGLLLLLGGGIVAGAIWIAMAAL